MLPVNDARILSLSEKDRARFWSLVKKGPTCWVFGSPKNNQYASFGCGGLSYWAHRCALLWATGKPQLKKYACHRCRIKNCVNPDHLYWGTQSENILDSVREKTHSSQRFHGEACATSRLKENQVLQIYDSIAAGGVSLSDAAQRYGVAVHTIQNIVARATWKRILASRPPIALSIAQRGGVKTRGENHLHAKLTAALVLEIRRKILSGSSQKNLAEEYCVSKSTVNHIATDRVWAHVGWPDGRQSLVKNRPRRVAKPAQLR